MNNKINVYLLTGFLGAGKTTVLNYLLKAKLGERNVVIENEFGKASIDGQLVDKSFSQMYELSNGCVCCSLDEELYDVLSLMANSPERAQNLFLETTGIADVGSVAAIFSREDVAKVFDLKRVICITDAETVEDYLDVTNETLRQVVAADLIVINKVNFVTQEYVQELREILASINPMADIVTSEDGRIPSELLDLPLDDDRILLHPEPRELVGKHNHKIVTVTYCTENEFYKDYLLHTLNVTLMLHYSQIYRIKGFVKLEGSPDKMLVQSTGKRLVLENLGPWEEENPTSELVFIGVDIQTPAIQRILRPAIKGRKVQH